MTTEIDTLARLIEIAEPVCEGAGYELVDLQYQRGPHGWVVRVFIDQLHGPAAGTGGNISFNDCEHLSRELSAVLDVQDPIPYAYSLEVSSPGFDRPLRKVEHFRRHLGEQARITLHRPQDGRKNFQGTLLSADDETIEIEVDRKPHRLPRADVATARLVPDWDALMAGGQGSKESKKRQQRQGR